MREVKKGGVPDPSQAPRCLALPRYHNVTAFLADGRQVGLANSPALWLSPLFDGVLGLPEKRTMRHLLS